VLIGALVFAEISCLCLAAFFVFRRKGNTHSESASYAVITVFMLLSFIHQIFFITGYPIFSTGMEIFFLMASAVLIFRHSSSFLTLPRMLKNLGPENAMALFFLGVCLLYMAIHALLPVPGEFRDELYRIAFYEKKGFFPLGVAAEFPAFLPVNHLILFNTFLRFDADSGAGVFCFFAYLSIGFSTYALARRYSWQTTAFTTVILVLSMPRLVIQALYPGTQIISVAVALFCLVALYRSVEMPAVTDLVLLIPGLFFCISDQWCPVRKLHEKI